jgi:hypothetical protein
MRLSISPVILIALWLFSAPCALAAPPVGCAVESGGGLERLLGTSQAKAHPAAQSLARRAGLVDIGAAFQSSTDDSDGDDDLVVQDESPAARIDAGDTAVPALRPLGTLASSGTALPTQRILSRRSPRGPPAS